MGELEGEVEEQAINANKMQTIKANTKWQDNVRVQLQGEKGSVVGQRELGEETFEQRTKWWETESTKASSLENS